MSWQHLVLLTVACAALCGMVHAVSRRMGWVTARRLGRKRFLVPPTSEGGVAFLAGFLACLSVSYPELAKDSLLLPAEMQARHLGLGLSLICVWAAGRWADHHKHSHLWTVAILAAGALCLAVSGFLVHTFRVGGTIYDLGWFEIPATVLWMVIISEFFRLFEGLDGLLVGLVIGAVGLMLVYVLPEEEEYARTLCTCALPALLGLFPWRVYPARMELRGIGAFLPGFVFGAITLVGREKAFTTKAVILPAFAAIAVFSLLCLWLLEQHLFLPRKRE